MTKQTKMLLGVGALAFVGYLVWTKMSGTKANASGKKSSASKGGKKCPKGQVPAWSKEKGWHCINEKEITTAEGYGTY